MHSAEFQDFERGVRGNTAEHLSSLQYQYQQDLQRKKKLEKQLQAIKVEYKPAHDAFMMYSKLEHVGLKKTLTGKVVMQ